MKFIFILGMASFLFVGTINAQEYDITGKWTLTKIQQGDEISEVNSGIIFDENQNSIEGGFIFSYNLHTASYKIAGKEKILI